MPAFAEKYTDEQRDAAVFAYTERKLTADRVSELAARGELTGKRGGELAAFKIPPNTIRSLARRALDKRRGKVESRLGPLPAADANEQLRRRLVNLADAMLEAEERRKPDTVDPERVRQIARAVREAEQIRGARGAPPAPRSRDENGREHGPRATGGMAGALMKDHARSNGRGRTVQTGDEPAQDTPPHTHVDRDSSGATLAPDDARSNGESGGGPGAYVREQWERLSSGGD